MKINKLSLVILALIGVIHTCKSQVEDSHAIVQTSVHRIGLMPSHPNHYKQLDWKNKALLFDSLVFDFTAKEEFLPLIWIDSASNK
ncbi:MAG: hypothetical protein U0945_08500, partial [Flavobacterium sp.]|nr:hypothetical protein [Flavobacterium sp.]